MKKTQKITKEMKIDEVVKNYPKTPIIFMNHGLHCVGCAISQTETIEEAAKLHQIDLEKLLGDLNKTAKKA